MVQGGATINVIVARLGRDSVTVKIGGSVTHLAIDARGNITGGAVPSQGLRIVRTTEKDAPSTLLDAPKPDYTAPPNAPYTAEEVRIPTREGFELAGTLTLPRGESGRVPAMVTITGSGLQDRDSAIPTVLGYRLFRQIADSLARRGIATLRMDDRGFGASGAGRDSALRAARGSVDSVAVTMPSLRYFLAHDPLVVARRVRVPILILQGATDRQVTPDQAEELASAIRSGENRSVTMRIFAETNHLFLRDPDGDPGGYAQLKTVALPAEIVGAIVEWTARTMR